MGTTVYGVLNIDGNGVVLNFESTGIDDNATSTAITIDASGIVGIKTTPYSWTPTLKALDLGRVSLYEGALTATFAHNLYNDAGTLKYKETGTVGMYVIGSDGAHTFYTAPSGTKDADITTSTRFRITDDGNVAVGPSTLPTTATDGFFYIPSMAGTPTGVPTTLNNLSPVVHDTTNNRLYLYDDVSDVWQFAALT